MRLRGRPGDRPECGRRPERRGCLDTAAPDIGACASANADEHVAADRDRYAGRDDDVQPHRLGDGDREPDAEPDADVHGSRQRDAHELAIPDRDEHALGLCGPAEHKAAFVMLIDLDDAWIRRSGEIHPPEGSFAGDNFLATAMVERSVDDRYRTANVLLRWPTSVRPDGQAWPSGATVTAAYLRVNVFAEIADADGRDLVAEWYDFERLNEGDWSNAEPAAADPLFAASVPLAELPAGVQEIALTNLDAVDLAGHSGLRMHIAAPPPAARTTSRSSCRSFGWRHPFWCCAGRDR